MLEESGIVVEVNDQVAVIQTQRMATCGHCVSKQQCGHGSFDFQPGQLCHTLKVAQTHHPTLKVGDRVVLGLEEQALLNSSIVLYLVPLLCLFAGAIGYEILAMTISLPHSELISVLSGVLGFSLGLIGVNRLTAKMSAQRSYQPVILQVMQR